jgi:hypothetical protein
VKRALILDFLDNLNIKCNSSRSSYLEADNPTLDTDITKYVEKLKIQFAKVNLDVPSEILNLKTFRDYYELFKNEDFHI